MKKICLMVLMFLIFAGLVSGSLIYAFEDIEEDKDNLNSIASLIILPETEVPDFLLTPRPTPSLQKEESISPNSQSWTTSQYKYLIQQSSSKYNIDPQIIYATIMTESQGNPLAFRYEPHLDDASLGLGQILTTTARKKLGFAGDLKLLYKPEIAIDLIAKYHRIMLKEYGNLTPIQLAIAYNTGSPYNWPTYGHIYRFNKWYYEEKG